MFCIPMLMSGAASEDKGCLVLDVFYSADRSKAVCLCPFVSDCIYSQTSIARTPMARLPWLIRTHF